MKKNEALSYAHDFIRVLISRIGNDAREIILFGSVARGDFDEESDVDIFLNVSKEKIKLVQDVVNKAVNEFEVHSARTWKLKGVDMPIKCIVGDIDNKKWSELKREITSNGITLHGKFRNVPKGLGQNFIFSFSLSNLKYKNQVNISRKIYGYFSKKGKKTYKTSGLLEKLRGKKLNSGAVMLPAESYREFSNFLKSNRVSFKLIEVWVD